MNRDGRKQLSSHPSQASSLHGQARMHVESLLLQRFQLASRKVGVAKPVCILCLTNQNLLPPLLMGDEPFESHFMEAHKAVAERLTDAVTLKDKVLERNRERSASLSSTENVEYDVTEPMLPRTEEIPDYLASSRVDHSDATLENARYFREDPMRDIAASI